MKSMGNRTSLSGRISLHLIDYLGRNVGSDGGIKKLRSSKPFNAKT